jgi:hypothetical protein
MGSLRFFHSSKADFHKVNDNVVAIRVHVHASFARKYDDTGVTKEYDLLDKTMGCWELVDIDTLPEDVN